SLPPEKFDEFKYADVEETILRLNGYALESRAAEILEGMQIPTSVHYEPLSTLSGGYKLRALLARTLASEPDLLLLDEPNNHLDILSLRWLEKFLMSFKGCALVVSHDHRFLDNVCTHIVDLDYERVTVYKGNYERFLERKNVERERQEKEISKREKEIADHSAFITRFKAKATKARQANSRQKRMERIVIEPLPQSSRQYPKFQFKQKRPSGRKVLEAIGISKAYGDNVVLEDVDLEVNRGDRIAIIGPNGIGKSTLLKVLTDKVAADDGMVEWGYETHIGYFAQDHREVLEDGSATALSWLWGQVPAATVGMVYGRLGAVLFSRDETEKRLENLSGGEAARLVLAGVAAREPNVLVLDEPSNHLDLEGIEALAKAVRSFEGTVLLVSHDRWFVGQVATRIFEIRHDGVEDYPGTYDEYLAHSDDDHLDRNLVWAKAKAQKKRAKRK
ncbi:MAG: ABC-F family ATP-binding cassette domain-containing protein, partial [Deltaproteobacteria bacterium]|nr:ABC-F family ATP-binding cassette domain-containing protein [Deltaproteobacteria bacterium]